MFQIATGQPASAPAPAATAVNASAETHSILDRISAVQQGARAPCNESITDVINAIMQQTGATIIAADIGEFNALNDPALEGTVFATLLGICDAGHCNPPVMSGGGPDATGLFPAPGPSADTRGAIVDPQNDTKFGVLPAFTPQPAFSLARAVPGRHCLQQLVEAGNITTALGKQLNDTYLALRFATDSHGWVTVSAPNTTVFVLGSHDVCGRSIIHFVSGELWPPVPLWGRPGSHLPPMPSEPDLETLLPNDEDAEKIVSQLSGCDDGVVPCVLGCLRSQETAFHIPLTNFTDRPQQVCTWSYLSPEQTVSSGTSQSGGEGATNVSPVPSPVQQAPPPTVHHHFPVAAVAIPATVVVAAAVLGLIIIFIHRKKQGAARNKGSSDDDFWGRLAQDNVLLGSADQLEKIQEQNGLWRVRSSSSKRRSMSGMCEGVSGRSLSVGGAQVASLQDLLHYIGVTTATAVISPVTTPGASGYAPRSGTVPMIPEDTAADVDMHSQSKYTSMVTEYKPAVLQDNKHGDPSTDGGAGRDDVTAMMHSAASVPADYTAATVVQDIDQALLIPPVDLQIVLTRDGHPLRIGSGGFGSVYRGILRGVTPVAIKLPGGAGSALGWGGHREQVQLIREVAALKDTHDPHVLQYLGVACIGQSLVLVTEYCAGGDLANALAGPDREQYRWEARGKDIAFQVLQALVYLHSKNMAHLDLKPQNVLLDATGNIAKVCDLGMSVMVAATAGASVTNIGTFAYAAPELLLGQRVSTAADMYSFGVLMWQLMSAALPKRGAIDCQGLEDKYPSELLSLLSCCLNHDQSARPSARHAAAVLGSHIATLSGEPQQKTLSVQPQLASTISLSPNSGSQAPLQQASEPSYDA